MRSRAPNNSNVVSPAWYQVENAADIASPALLVYPDHVQSNIQAMLDMAGGPDRLRPHVKMHKSSHVVAMLQAAGIERFKCSTIAEAEMLAQCGAADVQLGYPLVGPNVLRLARLAAAYPKIRFSALVDQPCSAAEFSATLQRLGASAGLLLDLDVGLGRSGMPPDEEAANLYRRVAELPGVWPAGLHVYDGHIKDSNVAERRRRIESDYALVWALRDRLVEEGLPVPEVVAGGSPTFAIHAKDRRATCSPGTCLFWDYGYASRFPDLPFAYAAVLMTRVISRPTRRRLCLDLGYKAVSPDNPQPRVRLFEVPDAVAVIHNEEHLTIETDAAGDFAPGTVLYGVAYHICPTTALYRELHVVRNGRVEETWPVVARDRRLTF